MRQIAGFGTAEETNQRFKYLIAQGQTGISVDFDMPTLMGYDSDDPMSDRRGRPRGRRDRRARRHGGAVRRHRPREDLGVDDDQPVARGSCSRCTSRSPRSAGCDLNKLVRDDPERHPQGVHRAEGVDLPDPRRVDADRARLDHLLRRAHAALQPDQHLAATTSPRRARARSRRPPSRWPITRAYVARGDRGRASTSTRSRRGCRFFFVSPGGLLRGDREVPGAAPRATRR